MKKVLIPISIVLGSLFALAQTDSRPNNSLHRISVVTRTTSAVNYRHKGKSTHVNFKGTTFCLRAAGMPRSRANRVRSTLKLNSAVCSLRAGLVPNI